MLRTQEKRSRLAFETCPVDDVQSLNTTKTQVANSVWIYNVAKVTFTFWSFVLALKYNCKLLWENMHMRSYFKKGRIKAATKLFHFNVNLKGTDWFKVENGLKSTTVTWRKPILLTYA